MQTIYSLPWVCSYISSSLTFYELGLYFQNKMTEQRVSLIVQKYKQIQSNFRIQLPWFCQQMAEQEEESIQDLNKQRYQTQNQQIHNQSNQHQQLNSNESSSSQSSHDDDYYYRDSDDGKFNLPVSKPFDLKAQWLGNTEDVLKKFQQKIIQIQKQKDSLKKGFQLFQQNQAKYKKSSLRKINFHFDRKQIYQQFIQKSRRTIQKLHPGLLLNIGSYVQANQFYFLAKMRRVSSIFNQIYKDQEVSQYLSCKYLGSVQSRRTMQKVGWEWSSFQRTFLYYKQIKYTDQIPPNSFKSDLQNAVNFINEIHKIIFKLQSFQLGYFKLVNDFMKVHRVIIALSTLSLTNLILIRKLSIVAFSNYLALNPTQRNKQQITKTKYSQIIKIVQDQDYKDCLIINTKVSNYLQEQYGYDFSVFILHSLSGNFKPQGTFLDELFTYKILMFHKYNDQKSKFIQSTRLIQRKFLDTDQGLCLRFNQKNMQNGEISLTTDTDFRTIQLRGTFMNCLIRDHQNCIKFSGCYVYNEEYHYFIVIKNLAEFQLLSNQ